MEDFVVDSLSEPFLVDLQGCYTDKPRYEKKDVLWSNDLEVKLEWANKHIFTIWDHSLLPSFPRLHVYHDPAKLKCFDEAGLKMSDVSQILVKA